ncbi:uncharacterized protein [Panulirus ornatus]|uniref:uncharacterized protein isoform X3 n=1 Tax=Panulirus ornatus TaxID=150431 RepID=UPI003A8B1508
MVHLVWVTLVLHVMTRWSAVRCNQWVKMADGMLSLSWNNHSATFCHTLASLRAKERYTDVTVTCEGKFYPVHKLVLSTCSEYFENMFEHTPCKHPVVVLRDVKCDELEALLSYMYAGVVSVAQTDLPRLIKVAELLQIKGLAVPDEPPKPSHVIPNTQKYNSDKSSQHLLRRNTQVQSSSSVRSSPYPRSRPSRESCDSRISPQPKCTRSEDENIISQDRIQTPTVSPTRSKGSSHNTEADWQLEPTRSLTEQNLDLSTIAEIGRKKESSSQEAVSSQSQACEILIKEEMMEDIKDSETGASDTGLDYASVSSDGGLPSISRGDHLETTNLMMMKLEQSNSGQQPGLQPLIRQDTYPEGMSTTLPGPSDIQGWFGAETMTGLPMAKGDTRNDSQMFTCDTSQQAHKRVRLKGSDLTTTTFGPAGATEILNNTITEGMQFQCRYPPLQSLQSCYTDKPYRCPHCPFHASHKSNLKIHIRTHTGEKPYSCPLCPMSFSVKCNLKTHIRTHTGEKPFSCSYCSYCCAHKSDLNKHITTHTV